jgi:hypothetical protein
VSSDEVLKFFIGKGSWIVLLLNIIGILLDATQLHFPIIFPRQDIDVGSFTGLASGLNENGVSICFFSSLRLIYNPSNKSINFFHSLMSLTLLVIFGSTLNILILLLVLSLTFISRMRVQDFVYFVVASAFFPLLNSLRDILDENGIRVGLELTGFDPSYYLKKILTDVRYTLFTQAVHLSESNFSSILFGYPKYLFNSVTGGNSFHALFGEFFSFGYLFGLLSLTLFVLIAVFNILFYLKERRINPELGMVFVLNLCSFSQSTSFLGFVYTAIFYFLGLGMSHYRNPVPASSYHT